jgi:hypothetical protein
MPRLRVSIALALALAGAVALADDSSACTGSYCRCYDAGAVLYTPPAPLAPLSFAFRFSSGIVETSAFQSQSQHSWDERRVVPRRIATSLRSRQVLLEDEVLAELVDRESEIAAALPADPRDSGAPAPLASDSPRLLPAFDFSGPRDDGPPTSHLMGPLMGPFKIRKRKPLREDQLLAQLAACEQRIARELTGRPATLTPDAKDAVPRVGDLVDCVAPHDARVTIIEILEHETSDSPTASEIAPIARVLDELDDSAYAPWADRPGRPAEDAPAQDLTADDVQRYDPTPLDLAFGYSRHSLEFANAGKEFRCRCAAAAQLPGHPALNVDQVLAELDAVEERITADLAFPLPTSMPASTPEPGRELRLRIDAQPLNFGWSGMTLAEQSGAAERFRTVSGVAMRFRDDVGFTSGGFTR